MVAEQTGIGPARAGGRIAAVDGLRGIAALYVLSVHLTTFLLPRDVIARAWANFLTINPWLGSRTFLVISGCIVYRSLLKGKTPVVEFWKRRLIRLYPVYLAVLGVYLVASMLLPAESKIPADPFVAFLYISQNILLLQGLSAHPAIITQSWTLTFFLAAYLFIPAVTYAFRSFRLDRPCRLCLLATGALVANGMLGAWSAWTSLAFGMVAAELADVIPQACLLAQCGVLVAAASAWVIGEVPATLVCLILLVMNLGSSVNRLLTSTSLAWIGKRSYSLYLCHGLAIHAMGLLVFRNTAFATLGALTYWMGQVLAFSSALVLAAFLHRYVDEPVTNWFNAERPTRAVPVRARQTRELTTRDAAVIGSRRYRELERLDPVR